VLRLVDETPMAEVLVHFETSVAHGGDIYEARAVGRPAGHMWEGWLEFLPRDGGAPVVGRVESTQPEREHLVYWATGLTPVFLEGALQRAGRGPDGDDRGATAYVHRDSGRGPARAEIRNASSVSGSCARRVAARGVSASRGRVRRT
jgi:hypothetical protein